MLAACGLASVGCTMCPDPFDYSGPVPNGSSPQNDFRARSNGILPVGAAPRPWPLIVKNEAGPEGAGGPDESVPIRAEEDIQTDLQQTGAIAEEEAEPAAEPAADAVDPEAPLTPALEPVPEVTPVADTPLQVSETPGWRSRR